VPLVTELERWMIETRQALARTRSEQGLQLHAAPLVALRTMQPSEIWVYGTNDDDGILAFTDEGIERVKLLLEEYHRLSPSKP
jgi:hypothetical protein